MMPCMTVVCQTTRPSPFYNAGTEHVGLSSVANIVCCISRARARQACRGDHVLGIFLGGGGGEGGTERGAGRGDVYDIFLRGWGSEGRHKQGRS